MDEKRILRAAFAEGLKGAKTSKESLATEFGVEASDMDEDVDRLVKLGHLRYSGGRLLLTPAGRQKIVVAFIGGGFEVIHAGHLHTISEAKSLADVLVVVVARDSTIRKRKGRDPATPEGERVKLLAALRDVDAAILGSEGSIYETLERVRPDIVALGYDQHHAEEEIMTEAKKRGIRLKVLRLGAPNPKLKTSKILQET